MSTGEDFVEARVVRPYTWTGGRTYTGGVRLPLEALVQTVSGAVTSPLVLELRRMLELCTEKVLSVAELSAHLELPLGVTRVLIGDLATAGLVRIHHTRQSDTPTSAQLKVLEGVLDGIAQL